MEYSAEQIEDLIVRSLTGVLSDEEDGMLSQWLASDPEHGEMYAKLRDEKYLDSRLDEYSRIDVDKALENNKKLLAAKRSPGLIRKIWPYAAAVIAVAVITTAIVWRPGADAAGDGPAISDSVITPGTRQAELMLADGSIVPLSDGMQTVIMEGDATVRVSGSEINYSAGAKNGELRFNTIRTPRGGEYVVTLSDGTVVWLNALSELKYPVEFAGDRRQVELTGEAYFEVAPDSGRIFSVNTGDYLVEVTGTSFNINAYPDESLMQTTLCTGQVTVRDRQTSDSRTLKPNQQLSGDRLSRAVRVESVDASRVIAWTQGYFRFDDATIDEIFKVLERWYDIDVVYADEGVRDEHFTGKLPRFDNLSVITGLMEQVGDVEFELKGNTVYIR